MMLARFRLSMVCVVSFAGLALGGNGAFAGDTRTSGPTSQVMAAGKSHALFIQAGTSVVAWGSDASGELGNKTKTSSPTSKPVSYLGERLRQVAAGDSFGVGISETGKLYGWGKSDKGQTGLGAKSTPVTTPTQIGSGGQGFLSVAAGTSHALAISTGGILSVWGDNAKGEVGNGSASSVITYATVGSPLNDRWLVGSAGNQFTVALKTDGTLWTWGHGSSGQLGVNGTADKNTPQAVTASLPWVGVSAGDSHVLAIAADGTLWTWGSNDKGQLGSSALKTTDLQKVPLKITSPSGPWLAVSAGGHDSFALKADGNLYAWGDNGNGQLGISNSNAMVTTPTKVGSGGWQHVKAGYDFTIGVMADGNVYTWGKGASGQLGNGATSDTTVPGIAILYAVKPGQVSGGDIHAADLRTSGVLTTYGYPGSGALGLTTTQLANCSTYACPQPQPVASTKPWRMVAAGSSHTLAIKSDGTLWAWGANGSGEVGNGSTTPQTTPVKIGSSTWAKVFAGPTSRSSFALKADGTLYAWGNNGTGQLGTTASGNKTAPTVVAGSKRWVTVATAGLHTLGITADGKLWVWGNNDYGELGVDYYVVQQQNTPMQVGTSTWLDVAASVGVSSAISAENDLYSWGYNGDGELGDGTTTWRNAPAKNYSVSNVVQICRNGYSALSLDSTGTIAGWGANYSGETGIGNTNTYTFPLLSNLLAPPVFLACGGSTSYEIDNQALVYAVGYNEQGQEGAGYTNSNDISPISHDDPDGIAPEAIAPGAWIATASSNNANAGLVFTTGGWTTTGAQTNTWFQIDMGEDENYSELYLDAGNATDYPHAYKVQTSENGTSWSTLTTGTGNGQITTITFPVATSRFVRITETATSSSHWSIARISVEL